MTFKIFLELFCPSTLKFFVASIKLDGLAALHGLHCRASASLAYPAMHSAFCLTFSLRSLETRSISFDVPADALPLVTHLVDCPATP